MRRVLPLSSIKNQPQDTRTRYVPGSGVGANSISNRRAKLYRAVVQEPPSPPVLTSILTLNQSLLVYFTQESQGSTNITNYEYSIDNGNTFTPINPSVISSPVLITGLTNGTLYPVQLKAVNLYNKSDISNKLTATPNPNILTFTSVGSTTWTSPYNINVEFLVVGGGGGGGGSYDTGSSGGGGGGMVRTGTISVQNQTYDVIVGDGGAAGLGISGETTRTDTNGSIGNNSQFASIISLGGGGGFRSRAGDVGAGGTKAIPPSQASIGGGGGYSNTNSRGGGGGGGASADGSDSTSIGGAGGAGVSSSISGSSITYGIGGNGGNNSADFNGANGTANRGNGGGGSSANSTDVSNGGAGGSGIVIIKY